MLEYHQEWRKGNREDMIHEPKKLTEALDIIIKQAKDTVDLGSVSYIDLKREIAEREGFVSYDPNEDTKIG